jgi:hypothetical protein
LSYRAIERVRRNVARAVDGSVRPDHRWCGRRVKVADGSSVSMPDTARNQCLYPQPQRVTPGCGFPVMRFVGLFSLASGALLEVAKSSLHVSERVLLRRLWRLLDAGDVLLTDCGFCSYADFYFLRQRGVDCVMGNHPRRSVGLRRVRHLGRGDRIIEWLKTKSCPRWLTPAQWRTVPETLRVREIAFSVTVPGFRSKRIVLATTLLDPKQFPAQAFADLYRQRWKAELFLRDIKITLGMDVLRCKTPEMIHKEFAMHSIAYNLIRALMGQAAQRHDAPLDRISFKGAVATLRQWTPRFTLATSTQRQALTDALFLYLARDPIPHRPNRNEPRARKRRPKNYQLLNKPRHLFKETPHRNRYKKLLS